MKPIPLWIGLSVLLVFALGTCTIDGFTPPGELSAEPTEQPDGGGQEEEQEGTDPPGPPSTGVDVSVPAVSPLLLNALNATCQSASGGLSAQALLFVTRVELELYQDGDLQDEWTISNADGLTDVTGQNGPMIQDFQEVPAGFNYTIEAQVFNERVSSDLPVVTGTSDVFSVSAGESTEVVIIADPYQPTVLDTDGQIEAFSLAEAPYVFNDPADEGDITFTDLGGERWFGLGVDVVADLYARVVVDPGGNADAVLLQFEAGAIPDERLDPGLSYGFFPDGGGGTRAAIMGPVDGDAQYYLAAVLMNRDGSTATESAELRFDTFVRPYQGYANAVQTFTAPTTEEFEQLSPDTAITRELFHVEFSDNGPEQAVHFFEFSIPWEHPDLEDLVTATVTMDLDVLEMNHLMGYESEDGFPGITLAVILDEDGMVDETSTFVAPLTDPGLVTTENVDGSTSVAFDVDIDTTVYSFAGLGISSIWPGNQYTLTWDAPGMLDIIIQ